MSNLIEARRSQRTKIDRADETMFNLDKRMRATGRDVPPVEAPAELVAENRQQEITVNVEWVAAAIAHAHIEGYQEIREVIQPLIDWANNTGDYRDAFDGIVDNDQLRDILYRVLDRI